MAGRQASFFTELFFISQMFLNIATQQCGTGGDLYSIYQMMLKGHTYKTFKFTPATLECREACLADDRCKSYNVVMLIAICELNNRTKEAKPEDFVTDEDRYYMAKYPKRGHWTCKCKIVDPFASPSPNILFKLQRGKYFEKGFSFVEKVSAKVHVEQIR